MESWTNRPDRDPSDVPLNLLRVKPGRPIGGIALTDDLTGAYTHFWHGRTKLCTEHLCEACAALNAARWKGYLQIWNPTSGVIAIMEMTASCVPAVENWIDKYGSLKGAKVTVQRAGAKVNSRVVCEIQSSPYTTQKLPEAPDLQKQLARMWESTQPTLPRLAARQLAPPHAEPRHGTDGETSKLSSNGSRK